MNTNLKQKRRIVIGDIHGEIEGFQEILENAGLIDRGSWSGGSDILIQTGDVIDRGPYSREAVDLLKRLQKEAAAAGGEAIRLCGNHELMILQGCFWFADHYDPQPLAHALKEEIMRGDILASYTDGERLYTHAGLRSAIRDILMDEMNAGKPGLQSGTIDLFLLSDHINAIFRDAVRDDFPDELHSIFYVGPDRGGNDPYGGIFWCDFSSISPSEEASKIPQIFGHTPTRKNGVKTARRSSLIDIDAGMCHVYGGGRVYLEITPEGRVLQHSKPRSGWTITPLS
jgi:hypothetical protein